MKINWFILGALAVTSLFLSFVLFANLTGIIFPQVYEKIGPLFCDGRVEARTVSYSYRPGETSWSVDAYCIDKDGKKDIFGRLFFALGMAYAVPMFLLATLRLRKSIFMTEGEFAAMQKSLAEEVKRSRKNKQEGNNSALERLSELKKMRDQNLISEAEYERKKAEIMDDL